MKTREFYYFLQLMSFLLFNKFIWLCYFLDKCVRSQEKEKSWQDNNLNPDAKNYAGLLWIIFSVLFLLSFIFIANNSNRLNDFKEHSSYNPKAIEREISKKLDEKNGYKQFQFRMLVSEAEKIQQPTTKTKDERNNVTVLFYDKIESMNIGEYPIENVRLSFFNDSLYRIDIKFSSYPTEIYQTFVFAYGQPYQNDSWIRGDLSLIAESWEGNIVSCSILAEKKSSEKTEWDSIVIFDKEINQQKFEYPKNEPIRAGKDINSDGVRNVHLEMDFQDFINFISLFNLAPYVKNADFEQKTVYVEIPNTFTIGYYPMDNIIGYFFKNKLYRIDVKFSKNREELFKTFINKFPNPSENNSWSQGTQKMTAMEFVDGDNVALILAPKSKTPQWEALIFYNVGLIKEKDKFEREAPKRAASKI